mgnify:CR=1 FL=1
MAMTASACNHSDDDHIEKGDQDSPQPVLSKKDRFDLSKGTNGKPPVIKLSSGYDMPIVGLGTYSLHGDKCVMQYYPQSDSDTANLTRQVSMAMRRKSAKPSVRR